MASLQFYNTNVFNEIALKLAVVCICRFKGNGRRALPAQLLWCLLFLLPVPAALSADSGAPVLFIPIECELGATCFIQNYVDVDPSPAYSDYTCGFLSYDGHKGTDFRLPDLDAMRRGVRVLAAAPGIVRAVRDSMPDISVKKIDATLIAGHEAGNAVVIRHGDGWETQYSHMRRGSIMVKAGDRVTTGQALGLVGLSGNTEFPHVDFAVRHNGKVVDPFTGLGPDTGCGQNNTNRMWDASMAARLAYQSSGILAAGFTDRLPDAKPVFEYLAKNTALPATAERIIFWVHIFGARKGDVQYLKIIAPDGTILAEKKETVAQNFARFLTMTTKARAAQTWPAGDYEGLYTLQRRDQGRTQDVITKSFRLKID